MVLHSLANSPRQLAEFLTTSKFDSTCFKKLSYNVRTLYDIFFPSVKVIIYSVSNQMVYECLTDSSSIILPVSYTHLRAHETRHDLVCRLLLEKKKKNKKKKNITDRHLKQHKKKKKKTTNQ